MTLVMHMNDWHSTIWASQKQITVNFRFTSNLNRQNIFIRAVYMHVDGCSRRGINDNILYFDAFSNCICREYCNAYVYEWLIHSRVWASQSNQTVNFCFTSDLHRQHCHKSNAHAFWWL